MKTKFILSVLTLTILVVSSCKKPKDGEPGPKGADGNANVTYSIFNVSASSWGYTTPTYYAVLNDPNITSDIINKGAVLVYLQVGTGTYTQLPLTFFPSASYAELWEVVTAVNQVQVQITDSDLTAPAPPPACTFKVVCIASRSMLSNPDIDFKNFESVKKAFNLKD